MFDVYQSIIERGVSHRYKKIFMRVAADSRVYNYNRFFTGERGTEHANLHEVLTPDVMMLEGLLSLQYNGMKLDKATSLSLSPGVLEAPPVRVFPPVVSQCCRQISIVCLSLPY